MADKLICRFYAPTSDGIAAYPVSTVVNAFFVLFQILDGLADLFFGFLACGLQAFFEMLSP